MTESGTGSMATANLQEASELLAEVDRTSMADEGRWTNKRRAERRLVRVPCTVRCLASGEETVRTMEGHTRDVSLHGIGFLTREHIARNTGVWVIVTVGEGKSRTLTGRIVYSRLVRDGWYLSGVRFEAIPSPTPASDAAQASSDDAPSRHGSDPSTGPSSPPPSASPTRGVADAPRQTSQDDDDMPPLPTVDQPGRLKCSTRDRALRMLAVAASLKRNSRDTLNKVILLSASEDYVVRQATIPALLQIGGTEAKNGLIRLLDDVNPQIQIEAAEALGQLNAKTAIEPIKQLLRHKKADIALRTAAVLGRLGDRSGLNVVRHFLATDNPHTRDAVRTLGIILECKFRLNEQGVTEARHELKKL